MSCSCKHSKEDIDKFYNDIEVFKKLFIKRMTVDSETHDARRRDFNQAIFFYDEWSGEHIPVFSETSMEMVMVCFDDAVKDFRRTFCDVENCGKNKTFLRRLRGEENGNINC